MNEICSILQFPHPGNCDIKYWGAVLLHNFRLRSQTIFSSSPIKTSVFQDAFKVRRGCRSGDTDLVQGCVTVGGII